MESKLKPNDSNQGKLKNVEQAAPLITKNSKHNKRDNKGHFISQKSKGDSGSGVLPVNKPSLDSYKFGEDGLKLAKGFNKEDDNLIPVEVETQAGDSDPGDFASVLKRAASRAAINDEDSGPADVKRGRGRPKKTDARDEFTTLVFTVITLLISISNFPETIRPEEGEVKALGYYISGLMVRNLNISGRLGENAMDVIGILGIFAGWFMRVGPEIKRLREEGKENEPAARVGPKNPNGHKPESGPVVIDPIMESSPGAGAFLNSVAKKAGENGSN